MPFLKEVKEIALPVRQPKTASLRQEPGPFFHYAWLLPESSQLPNEVNPGLHSYQAGQILSFYTESGFMKNKLSDTLYIFLHS
jgi:hypothetical protein